MRTTPFCMVSRSESDEKRLGSHESMAMFAMTRGPSMKPACAATRSRAPSEKIVTTASALPRGQWPNMAPARMALRVLPSVGPDPPEEVAEEEARRGDRKGRGHVGHGALARSYPWLAHDLQAVGDGLDARVGACAHGIGPEHEGEDAEYAHDAEVMAEISVNLPHDGLDIGRVAEYAVTEQHHVGQDEDHEYGRHEKNRFLHPPRVQHDEEDDQEDDEAHLVVVEAHREETEKGVRAGDEGDRDGQHIVDEKRAARYDAGLLADGMGGHDVAAAPVGEVLDDTGVGVGDDKDGERPWRGPERPRGRRGTRGSGRPPPARRMRTRGRQRRGRSRQAAG